jgi:hypothetical protein
LLQIAAPASILEISIVDDLLDDPRDVPPPRIKIGY